MGAELSTRLFNTSDRNLIKEQWANIVAQSLHEDGSSYSGNIGMLGKDIAVWHDLRGSREDAENYIEDHQEKWEPAIAVSYLKPTIPSPEDKIKAERLLADAKELWDQANVLANTEIAEIRKDEFFTCKGCKSRIATKFLATKSCPLCQVSVFSIRLNNKIDSLMKQGNAIRDRAMSLQQPVGTESGWIVGGWCAS